MDSVWTTTQPSKARGYPTTPLGELCLGAFESGRLGNSRDDLMRAAVLSLFQEQLGIDPLNSGSEDVWKNQFQSDFLFRACEMGPPSLRNSPDLVKKGHL